MHRSQKEKAGFLEGQASLLSAGKQDGVIYISEMRFIKAQAPPIVMGTQRHAPAQTQQHIIKEEGLHIFAQHC